MLIEKKKHRLSWKKWQLFIQGKCLLFRNNPTWTFARYCNKSMADNNDVKENI